MKRWKVIEVVEFIQYVKAETREEAKLEYSMKSADNATTIKFTAKPLKDGEYQLVNSREVNKMESEVNKSTQSQLNNCQGKSQNKKQKKVRKKFNAQYE